MSDKPVIQLVPKPRLPLKPRQHPPAPLSPGIYRQTISYRLDRLGCHLIWMAKVKKTHPQWPRVADEAAILRDLIRTQYRRRWPGREPSDAFLDRVAWNAAKGRPWYA